MWATDEGVPLMATREGETSNLQNETGVDGASLRKGGRAGGRTGDRCSAARISAGGGPLALGVRWTRTNDVPSVL